MIRVFIKNLILNPSSGEAHLILEDPQTEKILPIFIGLYEGNAIALALQKIMTPRPMTHDLITNMVSALNAVPKRVVITELKDSIYYAVLLLDSQGKEIIIDCRPSDGVALALRMDIPIYVDEGIIENFQEVFDSMTDDINPDETIH